MHPNERLAWQRIGVIMAMMVLAFGLYFTGHPQNCLFGFWLFPVLALMDIRAWHSRRRRKVVVDERDVEIERFGQGAATGTLYAIVILFMLGVEVSQGVIGEPEGRISLQMPVWVWDAAIMGTYAFLDLVQAVVTVAAYREGSVGGGE